MKWSLTSVTRLGTQETNIARSLPPSHLYHILISSHLPFSRSLFLSPSPHLALSLPASTFLTFFFFFFTLCCLSALNSLQKRWEPAVRGEHVHVNNGGGQLLPNEVCLMADLCLRVRVCVCGQGVLPILLLHYSASCLFRFYHKTLSDHGTWESNVNRHPPTHSHSHLHITATNAQRIHTK